MSQAETLQFNPPRYVTEPQAPLPQTCLGILEHSGLPDTDFLNVTDIPADLSWMTLFQHFVTSFSFRSTSELRKSLVNFSVLDDGQTLVSEPERIAVVPHPWSHIPFTMSKFWNGSVSFKFIAIKPPRTTGKLLIRYSFSGNPRALTSESDYLDEMRRGVCKEWDLGQSNEFEFDITAFNTIQAKMTWIPHPNAVRYQSTTDPIKTAQQLPPYPAYGMGQISIEPSQKYQPGGIFPDRVRIQVFRVYKNAQFYIPTDPRSNLLHCLTTPSVIDPATSFNDSTIPSAV
ncbi:putative capsid protein [Linepithema humile polycipivirus 1]|nr:putative capsid protein [Linepithema humile polycipivirus 1]